MNNVRERLFGLASSLLVLGVVGHSALAQMSPSGSPTTPNPLSTPASTPTPGSTSTPAPTPPSSSTPSSSPSSFPTPSSTSTPNSTPIPNSAPTPSSTSTPSSTTPSATSNIVGVASANGNFKVLIKALKAAGLDKTLSGPGPFTVFAPTDKAFAALPAGTVESLLKPANKQKLVALLSYHVVSGQEKSTDLKSGSVPTLAGKPVTVKVQASGVTINNAKVVKADIAASNGVIHVIDKVLLPVPAKKTAAPVK